MPGRGVLHASVRMLMGAGQRQPPALYELPEEEAPHPLRGCRSGKLVEIHRGVGVDKEMPMCSDREDPDHHWTHNM